MKRALVLVLLAAACGDNTPGGRGDDGGVDAPPDGGEPATLTSYVIDLVENQTANATDPRPFDEFATLPDPDGDANDVAAYAPLFP